MNKVIDNVLHRLLCMKWHRELDCQYRNVLKLNNILVLINLRKSCGCGNGGGV